MSKAKTAIVWVLRVLVGATFLFSGFAKSVDPWGFVFKIEEYLGVWGIDWLWRETVFTLAGTLSIVEFCTGFAVLTGCLRRTSCWIVALFMVFMLPLTAYIAIANPVADCGCFGDALVISNTATFIKNVAITAAVVYLLKYNVRVPGLYPPLSQFMPMILSMLYVLIISFVGITVQPLVDFRQYKVGTQLLADDSPEMQMIYEKDGVTQAFDLDALPDSSWTYVGRQESHAADTHSLAIFDGDDEVTDEVISEDGPQVLLVVSDVERHQKSRASMANNIYDYMKSHGGDMIAIIAAGDEGVEKWKEKTEPHFPVYTSDDTVLKEIVRGDAGLVYLVDGEIKWKRNIFAISGDFPDFSTDDAFDQIYVIDDGTPIRYLTYFYVAGLIVLYLLGLIRIKKSNKSSEKKAN